MFVFASLLLILALVLGIISRVFRSLTEAELRNEDFDVRKWAGRVSFGLMGIGMLLVLFSCIAFVPTGHVGVQRVFGKVLVGYIDEGVGLKNPLASIVNVNVRTIMYTMSPKENEGNVKGNDAVSVLTKDKLYVPVEVSVPHRIAKEWAWWVVQNIGDAEEVVIRPFSQTCIREGFSMYEFDQLDERNRASLSMQIQQRIYARIDTLLSQYPEARGKQIFIVSQILVRDIEPPAKMKAAIEEKLAMQQESERMSFVLDKERKEADRKRVEAAGIADFQRIVTAGITPSLLTWKGIEATEKLAMSQNAKVVVIGSPKDGLPLILGNDAPVASNK